MKNILLILFLSCSIISLQAQDIWVDCAMGRPYMAHFEAMKTVAKEWGIKYEVKFMGCKLSEETMKERKKQGKLNQQYFKKLAEKFGSDWKQRFDLDVKKRKPIYTSVENPVWKHSVLGKPYMAYFEAKAEVAKEWGINYETVFLGCMPDKPGVKEQRTEAEKTSKQYLEDITAHYGKDWEKTFEAEVKKRLEKNTSTKDKK